MRQVVAAGVLALLLAPIPAAAAETGTIEGRVLNQTKDRPQAGARVTLTIGGAREDTVTTRTDGRGLYTFRGLQTGEDVFYAVDVEYQGGLFPGAPLTIPDDTEREPVVETTTKVWDTTTDPAALLVLDHKVFIVAPESSEESRRGVSILESVTVVNPTDFAYIGRGADRDAASGGGSPSLGLWLPDDADPASVSFFESNVDIPKVVPTEFGFGITTAIPPGENKLTFGYTVRGTGGTYDLSRRALYATSEMALFATEPLTLQSERLTPAEGTDTIGGRTYRRWNAPDDLDPADEIQVLAVAEAGTSMLFVGIAIAAGVLALVAAFVVLARRRKTPGPGTANDRRKELLEEIARLDIERAAGRLEDERWLAERERLKRRVQELSGSGAGR